MISLSLWSTIAGVSVVAICCFASLVRLFCSSSSSEPRSDPSSLSSGHWQNCVYRDEDGEAADKPDERSRYRAGLPKLLIPAFALVTLVVSGVNCALFWPDKRYALIAGGWVAINVNTSLFTRERRPPRRFEIGLQATLSSFALSLALAITRQSGDHSGQTETYSLPRVVFWFQLVLRICLAWTSCCLPRRPDVYLKGRVVDCQFTCSAIERCTFAWIRPLLDRARNICGIEYDDLPALDHATRSRELQARFPIDEVRSGSGRPLWRILIAEHQGTIAKQWSIAVAESIAIMLPPICLYKIISLLEERASNVHSYNSRENSTLWFWVLSLTVSKAVHVGLDKWLHWVSFAGFAIPIRSQLSAVIFAKSMRMKVTEDVDSKEAKKLDADSGRKEDAQETDRLLPHDETEGAEHNALSDNEEASEERFSAGIVNLLGVDVQRISDFCGWNVDLIRGIVMIVVSAVILTRLIGWWSTLSGLAAPILLQPVNRIATKYYTRKQLLVMAARDNKTHIVTEALQGIRQIKFSATEPQWEKRILAAREKELHAQWQVYAWTIFLASVWITMPALIGATALSVYAWSSGHMVASVAFAALSVFSCLERTISALPATITELIDATVSANRIQQHLAAEERLEISKQGSFIEFRDASITWPSNSPSSQTFGLQDLNLQFPTNNLSIIHGKTGTGKSLLLNAIIGEADVTAGEIQIPQAAPRSMRNNENVSNDSWIISHAIAFVGQVPWIENTSVKEAILFGLPYRRERYLEVLHACALHEDIKVLPNGEDTEVGATGINLSGGQRWRLTFARALYSRAGILVLDDIFSAVDSHVGRHLLNYGILGPLGDGRTKILVTHHVGLVEQYAAYVIELRGNKTVEAAKRNADAVRSVAGNSSHGDVRHPQGAAKDFTNSADVEAINLQKSKPRKFVEDETREQGRVKWDVYKAYMAASGGHMYWILTFSLFALGAISTLARSYWLALWTETYTMDESTPSLAEEPNQHHLLFYLSIYLIISLVSIGLVAVDITVVLLASLRAARRLFQVTTAKVLRAQLRWLDTEPVGRILNRFVGDFALIDMQLGENMMGCINGIFSIVTIVVAALLVSIWMIGPIIILSLLSIYFVYLYMDAARDIKRLESTAKSPMFELIGSALSGLSTIRCFGRTDDYLTSMYENIDRYAQTSWYVLLAGQWMSMRQGLVGVGFALFVAVGIAYFDGIGASLAGFALSFALDFSDVSQTTIGRYTSAELAMNSTERVLEYVNLETEPITGEDAAPAWPSKGNITVRNLEVGYAKHLESVLKGISFSVNSCERVGIVGRTGSGKSSLTLALFRFLEARRGSIEIDGVDISTLKLHDLRSYLAIIPQDPVLFSGTLRSNLDPFDEYSDVQLLEALGRVDPARSMQLESRSGTIIHRASIFKTLSSPVTRGGSNLSQGEKQLVCIARAIITRPKILVLDEATSAVDMETDALIQRSIREEFRNSTLLVVAHRLSTVADFDKILVLSDGRIAEYDRPQVLAKRKGLFWKMMSDSGEKEALSHLLQ